MKLGFWQLNYLLAAALFASTIVASIDIWKGVSFLGDTGWYLYAVLIAFNILVSFARLVSTMQVPFLRDKLLDTGSRITAKNIREAVVGSLNRSFGYLTVLDRGKAFIGIGLALFFGWVIVTEMVVARPFLLLIAFGVGHSLGTIAFFTPSLFRPACRLVNRFIECAVLKYVDGFD